MSNLGGCRHGKGVKDRYTQVDTDMVKVKRMDPGIPGWTQLDPDRSEFDN